MLHALKFEFTRVYNRFMGKEHEPDELTQASPGPEPIQAEVGSEGEVAPPKGLYERLSSRLEEATIRVLERISKITIRF